MQCLLQSSLRISRSENRRREGDAPPCAFTRGPRQVDGHRKGNIAAKSERRHSSLPPERRKQRSPPRPPGRTFLEEKGAGRGPFPKVLSPSGSRRSKRP